METKLKSLILKIVLRFLCLLETKKQKNKIKCNSTYINLEVKNIKYQFKLARGKEFKSR